MANDYLKQLGALGDALQNLWDAAEAQQKCAEQQIRTAQSAIASVNSAAIALRDAARSLPRQTAEEMHHAFDNAGNLAAEKLQARFFEADRLAEQAAKRYRSAVKWASWRMFALVILLGSAVGAGGALVMNHEIKTLRDEKDRLAETVAALDKMGGRGLVQSCKDRLGRQRTCIQVVSDQSGQKAWAIIAGY